MEEVTADVSRQGFEAPARPGAGINARPWPVDLDDTPYDELGWWLGHLAGWLDYARAQHGVARAVRVLAAERLAAAKANAITASTATKITDKRAEAELDVGVAEARALEARAHQQHALLEEIVGGLDGKYNAISREITRRDSAVRNTGRGSVGGGA